MVAIAGIHMNAKMLQFESKQFREETRDTVLTNFLLNKWALWSEGLKNLYNVIENQKWNRS